MGYEKEVVFEYVRSRGPGGQNVNRSSTGVMLRWNLWSSRYFNLQQKELIFSKLAAQLTKEGDVCLRSDEFRSQEANKRRGLEKLEQMLKRALFVAKKRKKTKPTRGSKERRHEKKRGRAEIKKYRSRVDY